MLRAWDIPANLGSWVHSVVVRGGKRMKGMPKQALLDEGWLHAMLDKFCRGSCPEREDRQYYERYGKTCPYCSAGGFVDWLLQALGGE